MQRRRRSRSRDQGRREHGDGIADTPFIVIGSERLYFPARRVARSRQTRIRHKHIAPIALCSCFPCRRLCERQAGQYRFADMIILSAKTAESSAYFPVMRYRPSLILSRSWFPNSSHASSRKNIKIYSIHRTILKCTVAILSCKTLTRAILFHLLLEISSCGRFLSLYLTVSFAEICSKSGLIPTHLRESLFPRKKRSVTGVVRPCR